jgi:hypothetical protein
MPGTNQPSIGKKNQEKELDSIKLTPKIAGEVMKVLLTGEPSAISDLKIDGAEEIVARVNAGIYQAGEAAKPALRRGVNKVTNTTLGTVCQVGLLLLGGGAGIYLSQKGLREYFKKGGEEAAENSEDLLSD